MHAVHKEKINVILFQMVVINNSCFRIYILLDCDSNTQTVSYLQELCAMGKDSLLKRRDLWQNQAQRGIWCDRTGREGKEKREKIKA